MIFADVINNTESGLTADDRPGNRIWPTLFEGASRLAQHAQPPKYSWNMMTAYMNALAVVRAKRLNATYGKNFSPEIYGVSGVRNNHYLPITATNPGVTVDNTTAVPFDDSSAAPVTSSLSLDQHGSIASVFVSVDMDHSWTPDLVVSLTHVDPGGGGERQVVLFNQFGDQAEDQFVLSAAELAEFNEMDMFGEWKLAVADVQATGDQGLLKSWSLRVVPNR